MTIAVRSYDFTLTALGGRRLDVRGEFFKLTSATGTLEVAIDDGGFVPVLPGQGFKPAGGFNALTIRDTSNAANVGRITIGDGDFIDDRISGEVSVIDGGRSITVTGRAFIAVGYVSAGAGQWAATALWNKSTTHRLVLKQVRYEYLAGGGYIPVQRLINATFGVVGSAPVNKDSNGPTSSNSEVRNLINGGAAPAHIGEMAIDVAMGTWRTITFEQPIVLEPGFGYMFTQNVAAGSQFAAVWDYFEEAL